MTERALSKHPEIKEEYILLIATALDDMPYSTYSETEHFTSHRIDYKT